MQAANQTINNEKPWPETHPGVFCIFAPHVLKVASGKQKIAIQNGHIFSGATNGQQAMDIDLNKIHQLARTHAVDNNVHTVLIKSKAAYEISKKKKALEAELAATTQAYEREVAEHMASVDRAQNLKENEAFLHNNPIVEVENPYMVGLPDFVLPSEQEELEDNVDSANAEVEQTV